MCKECCVTLSRVIDGVNFYRLKCRFQAMADPSSSILHLVMIRLKAKIFFLPCTFSSFIFSLCLYKLLSADTRRNWNSYPLPAHSSLGWSLLLTSKSRNKMALHCSTQNKPLTSLVKYSKCLFFRAFLFQKYLHLSCFLYIRVINAL